MGTNQREGRGGQRLVIREEPRRARGQGANAAATEGDRRRRGGVQARGRKETPSELPPREPSKTDATVKRARPTITGKPSVGRRLTEWPKETTRVD